MPCSANPHSTKSHPARGWPITLLYQGYFSAKSHSKRVTWDLAKPLIHLSSLYQITIIQFTHPQTGNNHTPITNITPRFPMKGREEEKTLSLTEGGAHIWVCLCRWVCVRWCHCVHLYHKWWNLLLMVLLDSWLTSCRFTIRCASGQVCVCGRKWRNLLSKVVNDNWLTSCRFTTMCVGVHVWVYVNMYPSASMRMQMYMSAWSIPTCPWLLFHFKPTGLWGSEFLKYPVFSTLPKS